MELSVLIDQIYDTVMEVQADFSAPAAYINVRAGKNCPFSEDEMWEAFGKKKWNSPLSSSELNVVIDDGFAPHSVLVESVSPFEDENGNSADIPINKVISLE